MVFTDIPGIEHTVKLALHPYVHIWVGCVINPNDWFSVQYCDWLPGITSAQKRLSAVLIGHRVRSQSFFRLLKPLLHSMIEHLEPIKETEEKSEFSCTYSYLYRWYHNSRTKDMTRLIREVSYRVLLKYCVCNVRQFFQHFYIMNKLNL